MNEQTFTVTSPADFAPVIEYILKPAGGPGVPTSSQATLISLTGDLGAGKTAFTQAFAKHLGITEPVVSPTFVVMKSYELDGNPDYDQLVHIDAYRFEDVSEAEPLRLKELFKQPRTLICLEWPERIAEILPEERIEVSIQIEVDDTRIVSVRK